MTTAASIQTAWLAQAAERRCPFHAVTLDPETGCDLCGQPEYIPAGQLTDEHRGRNATYLHSGFWEWLTIGSLERQTHDGRTWIEIAPGHIVAPGLRVTVYPEGRES